MSTTSTYTVTGMTCSHCVASVREEVTKVDGVRAVDVELATGTVIVQSEGLSTEPRSSPRWTKPATR